MWFTASLLFKSVHSPSSSRPAVWELSIRLLRAETEAEARTEAERIGNATPASYQAQSDQVTWRFEGVESICAIESETLQHGTEVYSTFLSDTAVAEFRKAFGEE